MKSFSPSGKFIGVVRCSSSHLWRHKRVLPVAASASDAFLGEKGSVPVTPGEKGSVPVTPLYPLPPAREG